VSKRGRLGDRLAPVADASSSGDSGSPTVALAQPSSSNRLPRGRNRTVDLGSVTFRGYTGPLSFLRFFLVFFTLLFLPSFSLALKNSSLSLSLSLSPLRTILPGVNKCNVFLVKVQQ